MQLQPVRTSNNKNYYLNGFLVNVVYAATALVELLNNAVVQNQVEHTRLFII